MDCQTKKQSPSRPFMKKNPTRPQVIGGFSPTDLIQKSKKKVGNAGETPVGSTLGAG